MLSVCLGDLAEQLNATIHGDSDFVVTGAAALEKAGPGDLTFVADESHVSRLADCQAGAIILPATLQDSPRLTRVSSGKRLVFVADAQTAFMQILAQLRPQRRKSEVGVSPAAHVDASATVGAGTNVHPGAHIGADAVVGENCEIYPHAVIGAGCQVGNDCVIHPHAVLYDDVTLGHRVIVHSGAVLGADGYSYKLVQGKHERIPHFGSVVVQDDVEIGANTAIDRGMIGDTIIGTGTKVDNLVQIAHNCEVGPHNLLVAQVGLAGSVTTGSHVVCAGQVGIADHIHLGDRVVIGAKAAVHQNVPADQTWIGHPAAPVDTTFRIMMASKKLPAMREQFRKMQKDLQALQKQLTDSDNPATSNSAKRDAA